jgi:hypothetical protein
MAVGGDGTRGGFVFGHVEAGLLELLPFFLYGLQKQK